MAICLPSNPCYTTGPALAEEADPHSQGEQAGCGACGAAWNGAAAPPAAAAAEAAEPAGAALMPTSVGGPPPTASRQGRDKQRYTEDGARLVAGCIPVRFHSGAGRLEDVEVLLISSRGGKGWVFPKGGWEDDETVESAAKRETVEEAGVRGTIQHPKVGEFRFQSNKQARVSSAAGGGCCVAHIFVMVVGEELEAWPEHPQRQRRWMPLAEASGACRHAWMRDALHAWARSQGWQLPDTPPPPPRTDSGALSLDGLASPLGGQSPLPPGGQSPLPPGGQSPQGPLGMPSAPQPLRAQSPVGGQSPQA